MTGRFFGAAVFSATAFLAGPRRVAARGFLTGAFFLTVGFFLATETFDAFDAFVTFFLVGFIIAFLTGFLVVFFLAGIYLAN
ncbi:MAG: hypothetical protein ABIG32_01765 [Candidatus Uhrbacteria bacterium]|nr:hypothetical protein [Patescibacteria group bacterium]MBU1907294.1 hypothetical protein [Patescibacteria group bacterium]